MRTFKDRLLVCLCGPLRLINSCVALSLSHICCDSAVSRSCRQIVSPGLARQSYCEGIQVCCEAVGLSGNCALYDLLVPFSFHYFSGNLMMRLSLMENEVLLSAGLQRYSVLTTGRRLNLARHTVIKILKSLLLRLFSLTLD